MASSRDVLSAVRLFMMEGKVEEAAESLTHLWTTLSATTRTSDVAALHSISLELADRFPVAESVSVLLHRATIAYAQVGDFPSATGTATRMVSVWRARCQSEPTGEMLGGHAHALDTLAAVYRARGMRDAVIGCLVELAEWHFTVGNGVGVAWVLRELGALAFEVGDLAGAAVKFTRADEVYAEDAEATEDDPAARERAECHVLLGRVAHAEGDVDAARQWFERALTGLTGAAADEVRALVEATDAGNVLPEPVVVKIGEFGLPMWEVDGTPERTRRSPVPA